MGAFIASSMTIAGYLGEIVGYKAGLALTREELGEHLSDTPVKGGGKTYHWGGAKLCHRGDA